MFAVHASGNVPTALQLTATDPAIGSGPWALALQQAVSLRWADGSLDVGAYHVSLDEVRPVSGPNYEADQGRITVTRDGQPVWLIDSAYPVAAVTGLFRTRLLISTRIVRECTPSELDAVIRHEAAHVRRRDNLVRAAMRYLPDPFLLVASGHALQSDWAAAAEEAADDEAAGPRAEARSELAAALVRQQTAETLEPPHR